MSFELVHLSDLHFGNPRAHLTGNQVSKALDTIFSQVSAKNAFLIISGDVTLQGRAEGYEEAFDVISGAVDRHGIPRSNVLACPGNHDIVIEQPGKRHFSSFDAWSSRIRADTQCTFAGSPVRLVQHQAADFLLFNTAYHLDHTKGLADLREAERLLKMLAPKLGESENRPRIAIAHHHMIPVSDDDTSTTRNAYGLLSLLEKYDFSALLHGHQHAMQNLFIGDKKMRISGIGSFGFLTAGFMNTAAIYRGNQGIIETIEYLGLTLDTDSGVVSISPTTTKV